MDGDWERLADAVRAARRALGFTQEKLAELAGVKRTAIQRIERGTPFTRVTGTLRSVEAAVGWKRGSVEAILGGGDPTPLEEPAGMTPAAQPAVGEGLPLRIAQALTEGATLDTTIIPIGAAAEMVIVVKGRPSATPEELREALLAWERREGHLERLGEAADDSSGHRNTS